MRGDDLPDGHSVCRLVKGVQIDPENNRPLAPAFERKAKDDDGLSFNWLGCSHLRPGEERRHVLEICRSKRDVPGSERMVIAQVGAAIAAAKSVPQGAGARMVEDPCEGVKSSAPWADPSHALMVGYAFADDAVVREALAEECEWAVGDAVGKA